MAYVLFEFDASKSGAGNLEDPDAVITQNIANGTSEINRALQVVEHCNRCHDVELARSEDSARSLGRKKIGNDSDRRLDPLCHI